MSEQEQNPGSQSRTKRPPPRTEEMRARGQREELGKEPLINHSNGVDFEYIQSTESSRTIPSGEGKERVLSEIHRVSSTRIEVSPSVEKLREEAHKRQSSEPSRQSLSRNTYDQLEQTCREAIRDMAERVKQQQEKINCLLQDLEKAKRGGRRTPSPKGTFDKGGRGRTTI